MFCGLTRILDAIGSWHAPCKGTAQMLLLRPHIVLGLLLVVTGCTAIRAQDAPGARDDTLASAVPTPDPTGVGPRVELPAEPTGVVVPASLRGLEAELESGEWAVVPCATCHALRAEPYELPADPASLGAPHTGLELAHGDLACASCHDPSSADRLHMASGESIALTEAMRLCAQCHGPQFRDYRAGAHGGMQGYWDTSRGPRTRRHCVDCHLPHAPAFPRVMPMPPPRDRFLDHHSTENGHD